ncbi:hypothetical protein F5B20DRAFT_554815 [Whalleya microplaca]|nr:hypothetical protein F5B20DRAFT_554815 [Whalleya microplaca]
MGRKPAAILASPPGQTSVTDIDSGGALTGPSHSDRQSSYQDVHDSLTSLSRTLEMLTRESPKTQAQRPAGHNFNLGGLLPLAQPMMQGFQHPLPVENQTVEGQDELFDDDTSASTSGDSQDHEEPVNQSSSEYDDESKMPAANIKSSNNELDKNVSQKTTPKGPSDGEHGQPEYPPVKESFQDIGFQIREGAKARGLVRDDKKTNLQETSPSTLASESLATPESLEIRPSGNAPSQATFRSTQPQLEQKPPAIDIATMKSSSRRRRNFTPRSADRESAPLRVPSPPTSKHGQQPIDTSTHLEDNVCAGNYTHSPELGSLDPGSEAEAEAGMLPYIPALLPRRPEPSLPRSHRIPKLQPKKTARRSSSVELRPRRPRSTSRRRSFSVQKPRGLVKRGRTRWREGEEDGGADAEEPGVRFKNAAQEA